MEPKAETMNESWIPTAELRILENFCHVGRPQRLQQTWIETYSGLKEWRDIPIVTDTQ